MARKVGSIGAETADRVRLAALSLFARYGYAAVSMRQIGREIGLQAGAIYNHFPTKQHLLRGLMVEHMERLLTAWEAERDDNLPPREALVAFVRFHIRYHVKCGEEVFISYMELRNLEEQNFVEVEELRRRYEHSLRSILEAGTEARVFTVSDPRVATMAVIAMLTGVTNWYRTDGRLSLDEIEELYVRMISGAVGMKEN
ncbi:TetR family transcriptional regulator [Hoeflea prorocentri]|uniref:TetR/AcrR family transcriptional regulator n=1 Tax=Hoeflea prorocentri TaxID=1922333 RepID=A0A9X3ZGL3_9HYPH|nr:TetR/AcrR family transcriptional regulator [Hoeflea prorocentri]MCY6380023.1 TetR/AcrR family transcriptional regulator [Hoeflea prorocentri]MDA5397823.1 TetR/AcrR family transcriptional regulator [Hoeflea prorocentri]